MSALDEFIAFTGCDEGLAKFWLSSANNVLDDAVRMFFDEQQAQQNLTANGTAIKPATSGSLKRDAYDDFDSILFNNDNDIHQPVQSNSDIYDEDGIRKPDSVKRQRLLHNASDQSYNLQPNRPKPKSVFAFESGYVPKNQKEENLARKFSPPQDIMLHVQFWEARDLCKKQNKWLIVNIQDDTEFECCKLNRDVWKDECLKDIIKCNFCFWQKLTADDDGTTYMDNYKVQKDNLPHVSIIDPRTGALKWRHDGPVWTNSKKESKHDGDRLLNFYSEKIIDFLGNNPSPNEDEGKLPSLQKKISASSTSSSSDKNIKTEVVVLDDDDAATEKEEAKEPKEVIEEKLTYTNGQGFNEKTLFLILKEYQLRLMETSLQPYSPEFTEVMKNIIGEFVGTSDNNDNKSIKLAFKFSNRSDKVILSCSPTTPIYMIALFVLQNLNSDQRDKSFEIRSFDERMSQKLWMADSNDIMIPGLLESAGVTCDTLMNISII